MEGFSCYVEYLVETKEDVLLPCTYSDILASQNVVIRELVVLLFPQVPDIESSELRIFCG